VLDLLVGLWWPGDKCWGLGLFHPSVEGVDPVSAAEWLLPVRGLEPELQLPFGVAQAHVVEVVDGKGELHTIHQGQGNEPLDAMDRVFLVGEV